MHNIHENLIRIKVINSRRSSTLIIISKNILPVGTFLRLTTRLQKQQPPHYLLERAERPTEPPVALMETAACYPPTLKQRTDPPPAASANHEQPSTRIGPSLPIGTRDTDSTRPALAPLGVVVLEGSTAHARRAVGPAGVGGARSSS